MREESKIDLTKIVIILTVIFVILKLIGAVHWGWIIVFCPIWGLLLVEYTLILIVKIIEFILTFGIRNKPTYPPVTKKLVFMQEELYDALKLECNISDTSNKDIRNMLRELKKADKIIKRITVLESKIFS